MTSCWSPRATIPSACPPATGTSQGWAGAGAGACLAGDARHVLAARTATGDRWNLLREGCPPRRRAQLPVLAASNGGRSERGRPYAEHQRRPGACPDSRRYAGGLHVPVRVDARKHRIYARPGGRHVVPDHTSARPRLVDASGQPNRSIHYFGVIGRLRPGASIDRARSDLEAIAAQRAIDFPDTNAGWGVTVRPLHEQTVGALRPALLMLLGGVAVVLLITCINVANVLLARAAGRGRDLAIRSALGASRRRLIQQALTESVLLSFAGGIAGLGVMVLATRGILAVAPSTLPRLWRGIPRAAGRPVCARPVDRDRSRRRADSGVRRRELPSPGHAPRRHSRHGVLRPPPDSRRPHRLGSRAGDDPDGLRRIAAAQLCVGASRGPRFQRGAASYDAGRGAAALHRRRIAADFLRRPREPAPRTAWRLLRRRHHPASARQHEHDDVPRDRGTRSATR